MTESVSSKASGEVTELLRAWSDGDVAARDRLVPLVYGELKKLARRQRRAERADHTLQSPALIHEAYLCLIEQEITWQNRAHFFGIAARLMRQILINYANAQQRLKRGGAPQRLSLTDVADVMDGQAADLLVLNDALQILTQLDPQQSQIVELRFFGGLTMEEIAELIGVSLPTVEHKWGAARAWLRTELTR